MSGRNKRRVLILPEYSIAGPPSLRPGMNGQGHRSLGTADVCGDMAREGMGSIDSFSKAGSTEADFAFAGQARHRIDIQGCYLLPWSWLHFPGCMEMIPGRH